MKGSVNFITVIACLLVAGSMAGCSATGRAIGKVPVVNRLVGEEGIIRDRRDEYLEADIIPRLDIPESMDNYIIDDLYLIPEVSGSIYTENGRVPRPREMEGNTGRDVVIQRIGDESWIVAGASPSQIWPRVKDYWLSNRISLAYENPTTGVMESVWFSIGDEVSTRERIRVSIQNGFQNNSSEIRVLHMDAPRDMPGTVNEPFPETSDDPEVEGEILQQISQYLADVADIYQASTVSFLAGNISSEGRAGLNGLSDGTQQIVLDAEYQRSWAAVGLALNRSDYVEVVNNYPDFGYYEVKFSIPVDEDDEPGFFKRLLTREPPVYNMRVYVLPSSSGEEVLVEALETGVDGRPREEDDSVNSLIELIRRVIA